MQKKPYLTKRIIFTTVGTLILGVCVGILKFTNFGVDPFQSMCNGFDNVIPIDFGTLYILVNAFFLIFMFIFYRKSIGVYTFANMFLLGYVVDLSYNQMNIWFPNPSVMFRILALAVGLIVNCCGCAFVFTSDLGISTYDWIAFFISDKSARLPFKYARIITDLICCGIGFALGWVPGLATVITALCMGPGISFFKKNVTDPMFSR